MAIQYKLAYKMKKCFSFDLIQPVKEETITLIKLEKSVAFVIPGEEKQSRNLKTLEKQNI